MTAIMNLATNVHELGMQTSIVRKIYTLLHCLVNVSSVAIQYSNITQQAVI